MITLIYMLAMLGTCFIAGQSHITLGVRKVLASMVVMGPSAAHSCLCGQRIKWHPQPNFGAPRGNHKELCNSMPTHGQWRYYEAQSYWYLFKWPLMLVECPACLSTWIGAAVAWWWPELAHAAGGLLGGVIPFALFSCGSSAFLSFLVGLTSSGDDHV